MTREEAINKFIDGAAGRGNFTPGGAEGIVMGLEALGLLKFEEEIGPLITLDDRVYTFKRIVIALANQGYSVDKIK